MLDRIISSASIVLSLMCDIWINSNDIRVGRHFLDWLDLFRKAASGRALLYHLLYAILLNFSYGRYILFSLSIGCLLAYNTFNYIILPAVSRQSTTFIKIQKETEIINKIQNSNQSKKSSDKKSKKNNNVVDKIESDGVKPIVLGGSDYNKEVNQRLARRQRNLQYLAVGFSSLSFIWTYLGSLKLGLIFSLPMTHLIQIKYPDQRESLLMACYLFGTASPGYLNMYIFNFIGGLLIYNVYTLDRT